MKTSKWYLVNGQTNFGYYSIIKEEDTDLIVAEFPTVCRNASIERNISLKSIVDKHNKVVKLLNKKN